MALLKWCFLMVSFLAVIPQEVHLRVDPRVIDNILLGRKLNLLGLFQNIVSGNFNAVVDVIFDSLNVIINNSGMDPIPMPAFEKSLSKTSYIKLTNGSLEGISKMVRKGNVAVKLGYPSANVRTGIGLSKLKFSYIHEIKLIGFSTGGTINGESNGNEITVDLEINTKNLKVKIKNCAFKIGQVSIEIKGGFIADILNVISTIAMPLIPGIIEALLPTIIKGILEEAIESYNTSICKITRKC